MATWVRNKRTGHVWRLDDGTEHTRYVLSTGGYDVIDDPTAEAAPTATEVPANRAEKASRPPQRRKR